MEGRNEGEISVDVLSSSFGERCCWKGCSGLWIGGGAAGVASESLEEGVLQQESLDRSLRGGHWIGWEFGVVGWGQMRKSRGNWGQSCARGVAL